MFENLTSRLATTFDRLRGRGRLSESNIAEALREVRMALLEADVALSVVREFIERVRSRAVGQEVLSSLTPGQTLVRVVRDELTQLMGGSGSDIALNVQPPAVILVAGLQGAGKTTTVAKIARRLKEREGKKTLVVSCDVYRPAAIDQLHALAEQAGIDFVPRQSSDDPVAIARSALVEARRAAADVLLIDTAGRLHIDTDMMDELRTIHAEVSPIETLFVVDSMTGQDAATTSKAFNEALPLTGIVLTKVDGDARGGAALSVRQITGKPIKFIGSGEKTDALEVFHPDRIASRILGMGDVLSLIEEAEQKVDQEKAGKFAEKLAKGKRFDLQDFAEQLGQMRNMGGVSSVLEKMPGMPAGLEDRIDNRHFLRMEAIIFSMTSQERRYPAVIKGSRKRRIAAGSGTRVQDVNQLLKQFAQMQKMMKRMSRKGGMGRMLQGLPGMNNFRGGLPPGLG